MSNAKRALYEQVILDHNKNPRNFSQMADSSSQADGYNALCGDKLTVYLKVEGGLIEDISFDGVGCAISKSSASIMTSVLKGKTVEEARRLDKVFRELLTSPVETPIDEKALGKLAVFGGVREYPVRVKCATLAWHTMVAALEGVHDTVSTE